MVRFKSGLWSSKEEVATVIPYKTLICHCRPVRFLSVIIWNVAGALHKSNNITVNLCNPPIGVVKTILGLSFSSNGTWWWPYCSRILWTTLLRLVCPNYHRRGIGSASFTDLPFMHLSVINTIFPGKIWTDLQRMSQSKKAASWTKSFGEVIKRSMFSITSVYFFCRRLCPAYKFLLNEKKSCKIKHIRCFRILPLYGSGTFRAKTIMSSGTTHPIFRPGHLIPLFGTTRPIFYKWGLIHYCYSFMCQNLLF